MSNTTGATPVAPVNAVPVIFTLMPPGFWLVSHVPEEVRVPCSWYCQRLFSPGCQHGPAPVLQATGAAHWVVPHATVAAVADGTASAIGTTAKTSRVENVRTNAFFTTYPPSQFSVSSHLASGRPQVLPPYRGEPVAPGRHGAAEASGQGGAGQSAPRDPCFVLLESQTEMSDLGINRSDSSA